VSRFAAIKTNQAARRPPAGPITAIGEEAAPPKSAARAGKKVVSGHFTAEMSRALHLLAVEQGTTLQALMGEAFDDLLRKYGKHPFGER
jgi:hypothetical protein